MQPFQRGGITQSMPCGVVVHRATRLIFTGVPLEGLAMRGEAKSFFDRTQPCGRGQLATLLVLLLSTVVIVELFGWTLGSPGSAKGQTAPPAMAQEAAPAYAAPAPTASDPSSTGPAEAVVAPEPPPVNGLKISSQSWRRGGLGSKALITFTLRNDNDYAVKDIEIACAFSRRDGSHLTDRKRLLPDMVNMKSRKTFARLHVGFVNIYANKAKCMPIAASRV
jgi:hypothetical protein